MNRIFFTLLLAAFAFSNTGCEQHPASELPHHYQKDAHHDDHGKAAHGAGDHAHDATPAKKADH